MRACRACQCQCLVITEGHHAQPGGPDAAVWQLRQPRRRPLLELPGRQQPPMKQRARQHHVPSLACDPCWSAAVAGHASQQASRSTSLLVAPSSRHTWWLLQDELLGYSEREEWGDMASAFDPGTLFSIGEDHRVGAGPSTSCTARARRSRALTLLHACPPTPYLLHLPHVPPCAWLAAPRREPRATQRTGREPSCST